MGNEQNNITETLANFIATTEYADLPEEIVNESKRIIMDAIACMLGGYHTEIGGIAHVFVKELGGNPQSTIIGSGEKTSCTNAAYANGRIGNALDYDDTFPTPAHIGVPAVAAGLSLCEMQGVSGKRLIVSVAMGYELAARLSLAIRMPFRVDKGRTLEGKREAGATKDSVFASAGAAASALRQPARMVAQTLAIAGGNCPISVYRKYDEALDVPLFKYADSGWCSQLGVSAALLASGGYTGYDPIFDGDTGFWFLLGAEHFDAHLLIDGLGHRWYVGDNAYKLWPACRLPCYALTALEDIVGRHRLSIEEVEKVVVLSHSGIMKPRFTNQDPQSFVSTQFSIPHLIAMMVFGIPRPLWHTPETRNDPRVAKFRHKVTVGVYSRSEEMSKSFGSGERHKVPVYVEVTTTGGEKLTAAVDYAKGDGPWAPREYWASTEDIAGKFRELATLSRKGSAVRESSKVEEAIKLIGNLEEVDNINRLTRALSPAA